MTYNLIFMIYGTLLTEHPLVDSLFHPAEHTKKYFRQNCPESRNQILLHDLCINPKDNREQYKRLTVFCCHQLPPATCQFQASHYKHTVSIRCSSNQTSLISTSSTRRERKLDILQEMRIFFSSSFSFLSYFSSTYSSCPSFLFSSPSLSTSFFSSFSPPFSSSVAASSSLFPPLLLLILLLHLLILRLPFSSSSFFSSSPFILFLLPLPFSYSFFSYPFHSSPTIHPSPPLLFLLILLPSPSILFLLPLLPLLILLLPFSSPSTTVHSAPCLPLQSLLSVTNHPCLFLLPLLPSCNPPWVLRKW